MSAGSVGYSIFHTAYALTDLLASPRCRCRRSACPIPCVVETGLVPSPLDAVGDAASRVSTGKPTTYSTIGPGHQQDPQTVEDEHQREVHPGFAGRACEFFPSEHAPEGGDHIENHADTPDESAEQSEGVAGNRSAEVAGEIYGFAD